MRIVCPSCGAEYEVPESRLAPGKPVKCSRCGNTWAPAPAPAVAPEPERARLEERLPLEAAPAIPVPEATPVGAATVERAAPDPVAEPARGSAALRVAWVLSFVVLAAAAWAAYDRREDVMRAWPASERAYGAFGLRK